MMPVYQKRCKDLAAALRFNADLMDECQSAGSVSRVACEVDDLAFQLMNMAAEVKNNERKVA